ncbi:lysylphosphatidylglycerol synthase transmembrane domain-containing protein [Mesobacillus zeae]|uniref:Phosphatidylglycerol lysyltransferase n=1 Tax=Mesobacillus zeae TaxID=1917180 RepID=A0A398B2X1_9BACI|nr:lysylphosphatidylglycerol synthase transmembrane domain-containing protein [Mesobacillus zeae]RID83208.1 UPF0104 family protein [Mesobacillus zeae]
MLNTSKKAIKTGLSLLLISFFILVTCLYADLDILFGDIETIFKRPLTLTTILFVYFAAFCARGLAWKLYLKNTPSYMSCIAGIFYSLLLNHLLPFKAGDLARIGILKLREPGISNGQVVNSVVVLRLLDMAILSVIAAIGLVSLHMQFRFWPLLLFSITTFAFIMAGQKHSKFVKRQVELMKTGLAGLSGLFVIVLTAGSWIMEAAVVYGVLTILGEHASIWEAAWVNSITVAGQIFQVTPGGIGSYEAVMIFALGLAGVPVNEAYSAAVMTHSIKFIFSFAAGAFVLAAFPVSFPTIRKWLQEGREKREKRVKV